MAANGLIDPKTLRKFDDSTSFADREGLEQYLHEHMDKSLGETIAMYRRGGKGGVDRGRGDAPLFFGEQTKPGDEKFNDRALPPAAAAALENSDLVGMSAGVPDTSKKTTSSGGALTARNGAASAFTNVVLPRHRGTVERFFERKTQ